MDFLQLVQARRSVRAFDTGDVPEALIQKVLLAGQCAPSGGNCQPWHVYVIRNKDKIREIYDRSCHQAFLLEAPVLLLVCADMERTRERYGQRGETLYSLQDTAAMVENMLLMATEVGLGTCWCGAFDEREMHSILCMPKDRRPVALIPMGFPAEKPLMPERVYIDEFTTNI